MSVFSQPNDTTVICNEERFQLYISDDRIQRRIRMIAGQIDDEYVERRPILIGVLNGAFMVLADLLRATSIACEIDFLKLSSYGSEKVSSGQVEQLKKIDADLEERHVIVVEDIVDSGLSMQYIVDRIEEQGPASLRIFTLLHKPEAVEHEVPLDYVGFEIPDRFVLGYGLDYAQIGRNLPDVYIRAGEDEPVPEAVEPGSDGYHLQSMQRL